MVGYKDDLEAAHQRIQALEHELGELRAQDYTPGDDEETGRPPPLDAQRGRPSRLFWVLGLVHIVAALGAAALLRGPSLALVPPVLIAGVFLLIFALLRSRMVVVRPCELAVIVGRTHRRVDGKRVPFRIVSGDRSMVLPALERVEWLDLRARCIDWSLVDVLCRSGERVNVSGYLIVGLALEPRVHDAAVERFLGKGAAELETVALEAAMGVVRQQVAGADAEDLARRPDTLQVAQRIERALEEVGLELLSVGILDTNAGGAR